MGGSDGVAADSLIWSWCCPPSLQRIALFLLRVDVDSHTVPICSTFASIHHHRILVMPCADMLLMLISAPSTLGVVLPLRIAMCLLAIILEVSQTAGLATPYLEVDPGVRAARRCSLRLRDSKSEGASGKECVA